jgi:hypothetical protein
MSRLCWKCLTCSMAIVAWMSMGLRASHAQLQVTEIMSDTLSPGDDAWEWIEVRNTGATSVNLDGYIIDRLGDEAPGTITPGINSGLASNTIIPAGGTAILYDADVAINDADYNDALFRQAWGLAPGVPLIGVTGGFGGGLTNTDGTAIGFWQDSTAYGNDLADDGTGDIRVAQFTNAAFSIDFKTESGFPASTAGASLAWNGSGSYQDGANWGATTSGTTSVMVTIPGSTNSTLDVANPGKLPGGTAPSGVLFTEVMYNPNSAEPNWEWVEVFNNTGAALDFDANPAVFDDDDDNALTAENLTSGVIPNGTAAVLFNASGSGVTLSDMQAAWDPGGTIGTNFIPVTAWTALAQAGDEFAIWQNLSAYQTDSAGEDRVFDNALGLGGFDNETAGIDGLSGLWPNDNNAASIYLTDLSLDWTVGDNWALSAELDGVGSKKAVGLAGTITVHTGGDLGTPGAFGASPAIDADFNNDNIVDGADFLIWQRGFGTGTNNGTGDADGNGSVDAADLAAWKSSFGSPPAVASIGAVPEPASLALAGLAGLALLGLRSRAN